MTSGVHRDPRILALCAGYGGLERAVTPIIGGRAVAFAENDPYAARVFSHHHPDVPNIGDIRGADWRSVQDEFRPDVITAGFPCRNISNAGDRSGIDGQWSRVWKDVAGATRVVRPDLLLLENVAAIRSRGLGTVLGDLAAIGYDTRWLCVRASDAVGACHTRDRWLCIAHPVAADPDLRGWIRWAGDVTEPGRWDEPADDGDDVPGRDWTTVDGTDYGPAVRRWERVIGRPAPCPTEPGTKDNRRLSPRFEEWMMGLPDGWVTGVDGIPRKEQMRMLGNGLVPQQGEWGFRALLGMTIEEPREDDVKDRTEVSNPDKPRGKCTGCPFDYQLGTARSGEFKGQPVIRKHNSRTGPGLCEGAAKPPAIEHGEATGDAQAWADPAEPVAPLVPATHDSMGSCGHEIMAGEEIRSDGAGDWLCGLCSDEGAAPDRPQHTYENGAGGVYVHEGTREACAQDECKVTRAPEQLPHDRGHETVAHIPHGHDFTDSSGTTWRHGGPFDACTIEDCIQFRNRISPPPVTTPVQHQCEAGLYADPRNCPVHGVQTPSALVKQQVTETLSAPLTAMAQAAANAVTGLASVAQAFADPAPMPAEMAPVSDQPEPDRDRWGRYLLPGPDGKPAGHTRATTFAKLGSSTYALGEWNERMLIKGLVERRDLLAMAHGLDVKRDSKTLNKIADDAQEHAGNKVAANIGTAYHAFTERLDAGLITLDQVPPEWRQRCSEYVDKLAEYGLKTRREWIERTTAVRADQVSATVPVAGTLDRIFELPNGELVIGDLKTSSNIEYSWSEIAVQLALYAHGVNTFGLFDWRSKTWGPIVPDGNGAGLKREVRTDYAIVVHLPANGEGCHMYRVDLAKGWQYAQVSGLVQTRQKDKSVAEPLTAMQIPAPVAPPVSAAVQTEPVRADWDTAVSLFQGAIRPDELTVLYQYAEESKMFTAHELDKLKLIAARRWEELNIPF